LAWSCRRLEAHLSAESISGDAKPHAATGEPRTRAFWRTLAMDCAAYPIRRLSEDRLVADGAALRDMLRQASPCSRPRSAIESGADTGARENVGFGEGDHETAWDLLGKGPDGRQRGPDTTHIGVSDWRATGSLPLYGVPERET